MSRVENSPKINKRGGGGWKSYPIINKRASPYIRQVRVYSVYTYGFCNEIDFSKKNRIFTERLAVRRVA